MKGLCLLDEQFVPFDGDGVPLCQKAKMQVLPQL